ncbi:MAG: 4Fe-4S binding protein [Thermodesulfobacteriota bacterium]|nr:4Fe-4S binding protein [Thermodesulfobacteriota bacterium]
MLRTVIFIVIGVLLTGILVLWLFGERWRPFRLSTWRLLREGGLKRFFNFSFLHTYIYMRWTNQYVKILFSLPPPPPRPKPRSKTWLSDHYHGKVLTPEHAHMIINLNHDISLRDLEQVIPYPVARDLILKGPPDVVVYECACRHAQPNPCKPTQVCMIVGQPFTDFVLEHNPQSSRRLTQAEALELLEAEYKRGHLHSAWFKDAMLDRFYAICNCCKCCCGGINAMARYGIPMMVSSGYIAKVDETSCTACGTCVGSCAFGVLSLNEVSKVNWEKCMGCGVCVGQCTSEAMSLVRDEKKGIPLDVRLLS